MSLFELAEDQAEAETLHEIDNILWIKVHPVEPRKPERRTLPDHLPRKRIVYLGSQACLCCGGALYKLSGDVTETLELVLMQWKVIRHVREKHTCRTREKINQPVAPLRPLARGRVGPGLLAHVWFSKYARICR